MVSKIRIYKNGHEYKVFTVNQDISFVDGWPAAYIDSSVKCTVYIILSYEALNVFLHGGHLDNIRAVRSTSLSNDIQITMEGE